MTFVSGPYLANLLAQKLGRPVTSGEAYYYPGCAANSSQPCALPNATIPMSAWSTPAQKMLHLIGQVDNSSYPAINVEIHMTLVTLANATGPVPILIMFGRAGSPAPK